MKVHHAKTAFLIMMEVYAVFSAAVEPEPESTSNLYEILHDLTSSVNSLKESLINLSRLGKLEECAHGSFAFRANPFLHLSCPNRWPLVGKTCLFADLSRSMPWQDGRNYCRELQEGSDLVVFKDANEFEAVLRYVKTINSSNENIHFWIGGSDVAENDNWLWITGKPMPRGSPFWGVDGNYVYEPKKNDGEYCAFLYFGNRYYLHDIMCGGWSGQLISPLCQYNPFSF